MVKNITTILVGKKLQMVVEESLKVCLLCTKDLSYSEMARLKEHLHAKL